MPLIRFVIFALAFLGLQPQAQAALPPGCELHWRLEPLWDRNEPRLRIELSFEAVARSRNDLVLPGPVDPASVQVGDPAQRIDATRPLPSGLGLTLTQRSGDRAVLRYELRPAGDDAAYRLGPQHLYFTGRALLPVPATLAERASLQMCLQLDGLTPGHRVVSSLHPAAGQEERLLRWQGSPALAREIVVAAGALQQRERNAEGRSLQLLLPADNSADPDALADAAAQAIGAQRRFWGASDAGRTLLLLQPERSAAAPSAQGLHGALLLRLPADMLTAGPAFRMLVDHAHLRGWFRERFGPTAYETRPDDTAGTWFVEGFSLFYALRLHAAQGAWSVDDLANALTLLWQQPGPVPAAQPWLAAHWHGTLLAQGRSGLDAVLAGLVVPAAQAAPVGPISKPLAMHRLQAALRPLLGDTMRTDLQRFGAAGAAPDASTVGPCLRVDAAARRIVPAQPMPSSACRAWLGGGTALTQAARADDARPAGKAGGKAAAKGKSAKASKATAGPGRKKSKKR